MVRRVPVLSAAVVLISGTLTAASQVASYQEARQLVNAGIQAMGGMEALRAIKDLVREGRGTTYALGQSLTPDGPLVARAVEMRSFQDFGGGKSASVTATSGPGMLPARQRTVAADTGFSHNMVTKVVTPLAQGALSSSRANLRRDPAVLLLLADERAETLRHLGEQTVSGQRQRLVTFSTADGAQLGLAFDAASGLLARIQTLGDNAVLGDTLTETLLSDYREVAAGGKPVKLPHRVVTMVNGITTQDLEYGAQAVNAGPPAGMLDEPADAVKVPPAPPGSGVALTRLGDDDAWFAAGGSHHSLFVVFKDHVVVVEAPLSEERSLAVLAKIAETAPGKPVRYLAPTHYHSDHTGGLRTYIARGVTILTTAGNRGFVERLAAAKKTIRPDLLAREPRAPVIETFSGKRVFDDGSSRLELHDIGPSPHVTESVVAYLPKQKAVFESDLFTIPVAGPFPPASPALVDFAEKLKARGLAVETIVPGHGRLGTMADLQAALAVKAPAN